MTYDPRSRFEKRASLVLVLIGLVGLVASGFLFFASFATHEVVDSRIGLPGSTEVHLAAGDYELWIQGAGGTFNQGNCDRDFVTELTERAKPRIAAPDGSALEFVTQGNCASAVPFNGKRAVSAVHFTADMSGMYEISGDAAPAPDSHLYVAEVHAIATTMIAAFIAFFGGIGALVLKLVKFSG